MIHDYQPEWDYPVIELSEVENLSPADRIAIEAVIEDAKQTLAPALGFSEIEVVFVGPDGFVSDECDDGSQAVAMYCRGTTLRPLVGFDLDLMAAITDKEVPPLPQLFKRLLASTLAEAYQESLGLPSIHGRGLDEDAPEAFARAWESAGDIKLWLLNSQPQG